MKKFIASFLLISGLILFQQCTQRPNNQLFDVMELNGKSPDEVTGILQLQPDSTFVRHFVEGKRFIQLYYAKDSSEFRYRDGKLIEIIIHKPVMKYLPESIISFGLHYRPPSCVDTSSFIRWYDYPEFKVISFYQVGVLNRSDGSRIFKAYFNYKD